MAFAPIVMTGNLEINGTDVSAQVMSFAVSGARDSIEIPATLATKKTFRAGNDTYTVTINYLPDVDATAVAMVLWAALDDTDGTIAFGGTLRPGAASATNPRITGEAVVTGLSIGGEVNTVVTDSQTFPCTARPTLSTSDA